MVCPQFDAWNIITKYYKCMLLPLIHEITIIHGIIIHNNPFQCETQISWIIMDAYYGNMGFTWIMITRWCPPTYKLVYNPMETSSIYHL